MELFPFSSISTVMSFSCMMVLLAPSLANGETQLHLWSLRRLNYFAAPEHVAFGLSHRHGLPLFVGLRDSAKPAFVEPATLPVQVINDGLKGSGFVPTEADGRQSAAKLLPRDGDLYWSVPTDAAVPSQGRSRCLYFGLVAHLRQRFDQVLLVSHGCGEFLVLAHRASLFCFSKCPSTR